MTHDPLCPWVRESWWDNSCVVCDLIARVRTDEQSKRDKRQYESYANARKVGRQDGYVAALEDSVAVTKTLHTWILPMQEHPSNCTYCQSDFDAPYLCDSVEAIEALSDKVGDDK